MLKMSAPLRRKFLSVLHFLLVLCLVCLISNVIDVVAEDLHDFLLCRKCGREIVELADLVNIPSEEALKRRNGSIGRKKKVLVQRFKNPHGDIYDVVTSTKADVIKVSEETGGDTWWQGFNWRILVCPQCRQHVGWEYIPMDRSDKTKSSFFGLVLDNLLYENDADNLLVVPKVYRS